jgi:CheY-like chemotaxis protein
MIKTDRDRNPVVLVVEDETLVRVTALAMIEESGFEAIAASNADEAIVRSKPAATLGPSSRTFRCQARWMD